MEENNKKTSKWMIGTILFMKVSVWIVGPILIALFVGKYMDAKYNTEPWIFIWAMVIAFITSMIAITKVALKYIKKVDVKK